jgi:hypothetical protein
MDKIIDARAHRKYFKKKNSVYIEARAPEGVKGMNKQVVDKALELASEEHKGQLDDQGRPYFFAHIVQVHGILKDVTDDTEVLCAGILHDILEDTDMTYEDLIHEFNKPIADLVLELTRQGDRASGYYFPFDDWPGDRQEVYLEMSRFWPVEPPGDKVPSPNSIIEEEG